MKKIILTMVISAIFLLVGNVDSEAQMNFGVKSLTFHNSLIPLDQSLGSYFGASVGQNVVLVGGVDYGRLGLNVKVEVEGLADVDQDFSFGYIMPHGGLKFYLRPREEGTVSPYILGEVVKSFGSVDLGELADELDMGEAEDMIKDLLSPFGIVAGFGSEYYFSDSFGMGGEVGLRLLFTSTKLNTTAELSINQYFIYSGFTLNFAL
jgi:hypothetical protein